MPANQRDLFAVGLVCVLALIFAFAGLHNGVIGLLVGVPMVLGVPGYALAEALLQRRGRDWVERILLSLGASLAVDVLGGIALDLMPWGLQARSWAVLLSGITFLGIGITWWRRSRNDASPPPLRVGVRMGFWPGVVAAVAVGVLVLAITVAVWGAQHQPSPGFTQLWGLPTTPGGSTGALVVGIRNMEGVPEHYHLQVFVSGTQVSDYPDLLIQPQASWQQSLTVPLQLKQTHVEIYLYRKENPQALYRSVTLWLGGRS